MAGLNRGAIRSHARLLCGDASSTSPTITDAEANALIDEASELVWNHGGPRYHIKTQNGADIDSGLTQNDEEYAFTPSQNNYYEIASLHFESFDSDNEDGPILERISIGELHELRRKSILSVSVAAGGPRYWAGVRLRKSAASSINGTKWRIYFHPPSDDSGIFFSARVREEREAYSSDATTFEGTPIDTYLIARMVAWEMASKIGKDPDTLDWIAYKIPEEWRALRGIKLHAAVGVTSMDVEVAA